MFIVLTAIGVAGTRTTPTPTTPPQTKSADFTVFPNSGATSPSILTTSGSIPTLQLQPLSSQTKSADMTVLPPSTTGTYPAGYPTGYPGTSGYPGTGGTTGYPGTAANTYNPQQISINPLTGQYSVPALYVTPGQNPPGCGTFRNCLACRQASWYGCAWNPGNLNAPVGCSQTWAASQCTGVAGPTETLAVCAAYLDCASCTNQAGCVFLLQTGSCVYSAGPSCLANPAACANYPAQCPVAAALPYTVPVYDPTSLYNNPQTLYTSSVYVPGVTGSSIPNYYQMPTGSAYPVSSALLASSAYSNPSVGTGSAYPTGTGVYSPSYVGYGSLLPTGTLGTLNAYTNPFLLGQTPAPQQYLTTNLVPYTTTTLVPVTTITNTPGPNSVPIGNTGASASNPYGTGAVTPNPYATNPYGANPVPTNPYGANPVPTNPYGGVATNPYTGLPYAVTGTGVRSAALPTTGQTTTTTAGQSGASTAYYPTTTGATTTGLPPTGYPGTTTSTAYYPTTTGTTTTGSQPGYQYYPGN